MTYARGTQVTQDRSRSEIERLLMHYGAMLLPHIQQAIEGGTMPKSPKQLPSMERAK